MTEDNLLKIDGSQGEGGGQILRSSLALSILSNTPFNIFNIRAGRKKPGLMRQHLTAIKAALAICNGEAVGNDIHSKEVSFYPDKLTGGKFHFSIGTAGSTNLVLQTILPPLLIANKASTITLEGGTHNQYAPPYDFIKDSFAPIINLFGPSIEMDISKWGFYPAGGGEYTVNIKPAEELKEIHIIERGKLIKLKAKIYYTKLPRTIAEREEKTLLRNLDKLSRKDIEIYEIKNSPGPGNIIFLEAQYDKSKSIFTGFSERGLPAEKVAKGVCQSFQKHHKADVPIDKYLADQLMLPMAMAGKGSFITRKLSYHSQTNIDVIMTFLPIEIIQEQISKDQVKLSFQRK
ncbi:MAG: RNA 3'-phosphate cyclase [Planctomycetota bacterium]|nr:MAG: RNA 3'-phosphate cyclase [Planctomycetota bacterium]